MSDLTFSEQDIKDLLDRNPDIKVDEQLQPTAIPVAKKKSKYGNKKTLYNGVLYDSGKEARRAQELDLELRAGGTIMFWCRQPEFVLEGGVVYKPDFLIKYFAGNNPHMGAVVVEDVKSKGTRTKEYRIKKRQVEARYHVKIVEV